MVQWKQKAPHVNTGPCQARYAPASACLSTFHPEKFFRDLATPPFWSAWLAAFWGAALALFLFQGPPPP